MKVAAKDIVYTSEGTWTLLNDRRGHSWLMVEKHGYDPMCVPEDASIYQSVYPRGSVNHNVGLEPKNGREGGGHNSGWFSVSGSVRRKECGGCLGEATQADVAFV